MVTQVRTDLLRPQWQGGFARSADESMFPGLWRDKVAQWVPGLGPTGDALFDVSGFGNHGLLTLKAPSTDWVVDEMGYSLDYPGADDFVEVIHNSRFDIPAGGTFSMLAWFKSSTDATQFILVNGKSDPRYAILPLLGGEIRSLMDGTSDNNTWDTNGVSCLDGVWHLVACMRHSDGTVTIMFDGADAGATIVGGSAANTEVLNSTDNLTIGKRDTGSPIPFTGQIGTVSIYQRDLLFSEVRTLYEIPNADLYSRLHTRGKTSAAVAAALRRRVGFYRRM